MHDTPNVGDTLEGKRRRLKWEKKSNDISYIVDGGDIPDIDDTLEVKRHRFK